MLGPLIHHLLHNDHPDHPVVAKVPDFAPELPTDRCASTQVIADLHPPSLLGPAGLRLLLSGAREQRRGELHISCCCTVLRSKKSDLTDVPPACDSGFMPSALGFKDVSDFKARARQQQIDNS